MTYKIQVLENYLDVCTPSGSPVGSIWTVNILAMFIKSRWDGHSTHGSEQTKASLIPKPIFWLGSAVNKSKENTYTEISIQKNVMGSNDYRTAPPPSFSLPLPLFCRSLKCLWNSLPIWLREVVLKFGFSKIFSAVISTAWSGQFSPNVVYQGKLLSVSAWSG